MRRAVTLWLGAALLAGCTLATPEDGGAVPDPATQSATAAEPAPEGAPEPIEPAAAAPAKPTGFAALFGGRTGPALADAAAGGGVETLAAAPASDQPMAFGQVVTACGVRGRALGREVARYPAKGAAQWKLYDSDPSSTGPRTHYVTGFSDGCPRRITAALGLFGSAGLHEAWRYRKDNRSPWSEADTAYEAIKGPACGTGRGTPCPAGRLAGLERKTAFVTLYPRYGAETGWFVLFLSNGRLIAASLSG